MSTGVDEGHARLLSASSVTSSAEAGLPVNPLDLARDHLPRE
jgi:hypothetical protein